MATCANCGQTINYLSVTFPNDVGPNYCPKCVQIILSEFYTYDSCNQQISQLNTLLTSYQPSDSSGNIDSSGNSS